MKKIGYVALVIAIIALLLSIKAYKDKKELSHVYPRAAYVIEIDEEEGLMVLRDMAGLTWEAEAYDFWYGDYVAMLMYDNETPYWIYDDIILSIR